MLPQYAPHCAGFGVVIVEWGHARFTPGNADSTRFVITDLCPFLSGVHSGRLSLCMFEFRALNL